MTRSEALEDVHFYRQRGTEYLHVKDVSMFALIHKIYDDFEGELAIAFDEGQAEAFEEMDEEIRKAYLEGSNDCLKELKEEGKLK